MELLSFLVGCVWNQKGQELGLTFMIVKDRVQKLKLILKQNVNDKYSITSFNQYIKIALYERHTIFTSWRKDNRLIELYGFCKYRVTYLQLFAYMFTNQNFIACHLS